jgi:hypothetical protein
LTENNCLPEKHKDYYDKVTRADYMRNWRANHPNYIRDWERQKTLNPERHIKKRAYNLAYSRLHPEKRGKHRTNEQARAQNCVKKIPVEKCEFCGDTETLVRHHPDYGYPKIVVICCRSCHRHIHEELKNNVN